MHEANYSGIRHAWTDGLQKVVGKSMYKNVLSVSEVGTLGRDDVMILL